MNGIVGRQPPPRMIAIGLTDSEVESVRPMVGKLHVLQTPTDPINQSEWDCVVVRGWHAQAFDDHLCVLYVAEALEQAVHPRAETKVRRTAESELFESFYIRIFQEFGHVGGELRLPASVHPPEVDGLIKDGLVAAVRRRPRHVHQTFVAYEVKNHVALYRTDRANETLHPFLETADGTVLAGWIERRGAEAECWLLPADTPDVPMWVAAALRRWNGMWPKRFPLHSLDWEREPRWRTHDENQLASRIREVAGKRARLLSELEAQQAELEAQLEASSAAARNADKRLLTAQGHELVAAVGVALRELGFNVQDMDDFWPSQDKREDLRITDSAANGWSAIVEVRGYRGGAQLNDLLRIGRFAKRAISDGDEPDACWYLVNQSVGQDPGARSSVLHANDPEVDEFASDGGLVMDTASLFQLLMAVRGGSRDASSVRSLMRKATGRFEG